MLPAELAVAKDKHDLIERATVQDFSSEGLKLIINLNLKQGTPMEINFSLPEKKTTTSLSGEVSWTKSAGNQMELGLKIKRMNKEIKSEILDYLFPKWLEKKRGQKK